MIKKIVSSPYTYLAGIIILTLLVFYPSIHFDFTNWDDDIHITNNPSIQQISFQSLIQQFTPTARYMYHPITMITYMVEWNVSHGASWLFHLTNVLIHACNVLLLILILTQFHISKTAVIFCTAVFALHPLQVESVAWISGRKELLYGFFYLLSVLLYLHHQHTGKKKYAIWSVIAFILALLSKPTAVTLPLALAIIDYSRMKKPAVDIIKSIVPYLLTAFIFVFLFLQSPQSKLTPPIEFYSFAQRIVLIGYQFAFYLWKFLFPFELSACYAYPDADVLPAHFYLLPVLVAILIAVTIYFTAEKRKTILGIMLFAITILPVLQIIPFHNASLVADRYVYLPIIGLALFVSHGLQVRKKDEGYDYIALILQKLLLGLLVLTISVASLNRLFVWKNSIDLFSDVINKNPSLALAYGNRAHAKLLSGDYDGAIEDCDILLRLNPFDGKAYYNKGNAYSQLGRYDRAIKSYTQSMMNGFVIASVYYNRGNAYYMSGMFDSALADYHRALERSDNKTDSYYSIGYTHLFGKKDYKIARSYFDSVLIGNPRSVPTYYYRAECFFHLKQYASALSDLTIAQGIDPKISKTELYFRVDSAIQSVNRKIDSLTLLLSHRTQQVEMLQQRSELYFLIGDSASGMDDLAQSERLRQLRFQQ
ncbi:MAG: tetratricopeptide repeat protein [Bacteroidota bacterium]